MSLIRQPWEPKQVIRTQILPGGLTQVYNSRTGYYLTPTHPSQIRGNQKSYDEKYGHVSSLKNSR